MKKLVFGLLIMSASLVYAAPSSGDRFVDAIEQIAAAASVVDDLINAIEAQDVDTVTTLLRVIMCSDKDQAEKVQVLTNLYVVANEVTDSLTREFSVHWMQWARRWSLAKITRARAIEGMILERLDAERMPTGDIKEDVDVVYAAIAAVNVKWVKDVLRVLDRKGLFGKPLELVLRGLVKAAETMIEDLEDDFQLPRNKNDTFSLKLSGGILASTLVVASGVDWLVKENVGESNLPYYIVGGIGMVSSLPYLYKGIRRWDQRSQLAEAKQVREFLQERLDKVLPATALERQGATVNKKYLKGAIDASDLEKVRTFVWDLECSYLNEETKQELINWAANYAAEVLTKREEDLAYVGSWKRLQLDRLRKRSWRDTAKVAVGGVGAGLGIYAIIDQLINRRSGSYLSKGLFTTIAGYIAHDGWKRTTQMRQLRAAKEIKQLLRDKAN